MSTTTQQKWTMPQDVDDVTLAFPAQVIGTLMPPMEDIPEEFHGPTEASRPWRLFQHRWMLNQLDQMVGVRISDALADQVVDQVADGPESAEEAAENGHALGQVLTDKAFRHLAACQGSFEPKHEHKQAAVAWLASLWFGEVIWKSDEEQR